MTASEFEIVAIDPARLEKIRADTTDEYGNPLTERTAQGWEPLRCCLRKARPDEAIALICFTPWTEPSPWLEAGPVFVHFDRCAGYRTTGEYPPEFMNSHSMFNTFYPDGSRDYEHISFAGPGQDNLATLRAVLANPEVDHLHVRSATAGCFVFAVRRGR